MNTSRNIPTGFNPFNLLNKLYKKGSQQYLEWSIKIDCDKVEHRYKPTIYVYQDENFNRYHSVSSLLYELHCPPEVVEFQKKSSSLSMYQGLRIPTLASVDKCLFIHNAGNSYINSYRWKDHSGYEALKYVYRSDLKMDDVKSLIHQHFTHFVDCISGKEEFKKQFGVWQQEYKDQVHEVYLTFPGRAKLNWLVQALEKYFSKAVFRQLQVLGDLKFKNIGFESNKKENPEFTIYFTIPIKDKFPKDYEENVKMTCDFFKQSS